MASGRVKTVEAAALDRLRREASFADNRRSRINLHPSADDPIQEMIIAFHADCRMPPHKNLGRSESMHVIEGEADVLIFDDAGHAVELIQMGPWGSGRTAQYRMEDDLWHTLVPRSRHVIVHEVIRGPFEAGGTAMAAWAPNSPSDLSAFLDAATNDLKSKQT